MMSMHERYVAVAGVVIGVSLFGVAAHATTITVNTNGAPASGKCNLTDAIQAATTNAAVHSCPAGSSSSTDVIALAANTTYASYGKVLHVPSSGGAVVIQGPSGGTTTTIIRAPNYGYPNPNPINANVCPYPAALFTGGTVTLKNLTLQSSVDGTTGICQYAGSLTLDTMELGDEAFTFGFNRGGLYSFPNTTQLHRTLTITNSYVVHNYSFQNGGGVAAIGNVDTTITGTVFETNTSESSGGGLSWSGADGKMGFVKVLSSSFFYNVSYSYGGGMYLGPDTTSGAATLDAVDVQQNEASLTGGAVFVGNTAGLNKVTVQNGSFFDSNGSLSDGQQASFNSDANTYNAVYCKTSSTVPSMHGSEWTHTPPLKGDGTCTFP